MPSQYKIEIVPNDDSGHTVLLDDKEVYLPDGASLECWLDADVEMTEGGDARTRSSYLVQPSIVRDEYHVSKRSDLVDDNE